jgi:hypothetical protein
MVPPDALALLCDGQPLGALKILAPLAEAGDPRAINALFGIWNSCHLSTAPPTSHREHLLALAQKNGATATTLQRLNDLLAEEERGPTTGELEGCTQIGAETRRLRPAVSRHFLDTLGRSVPTEGGQAALDVEIEYERKMLVPGDGAAEENLAAELLQKGTPESQAEALTLLREAAPASPSAKTQLALCLLTGCPTPAPDPAEARELLTGAAAAGDLGALRTLAGPTDASGRDLVPDLPQTERYAWSQFLQRLNQEGCFGAAMYATWATSPGTESSSLAMSPADAAAAQARATQLLGEQLDKTRAALGCD